MANPVQHWEINSKDYKKAMGFYKDLFGWEIGEHPGMNYGLVSPAGDKSVGGGIGQVQPGQSPSVTFYITVDDLQKYLDKAVELGGKVILPPTPIPGVGSCALFADLDGNVLGLFSS